MEGQLRWFKHYNTASEGESHELLISEKDFEALYIYWWLLEQVSKFEDKTLPENRGKIVLNFSYFKRKLGLNFQRTDRVLQKIAKTFTLRIEIKSDQTIEVFVPNWLELQENRGGKRSANDFQKNSKNALEVRSKNKEIRKEREKESLTDFHPLIKIWNAASNLSKVQKTNPTRDKKIAAIFGKLSEDEWKSVIARIDASDFCTGKNQQGWKATFDWILQSEVYLKVMEGKYDNKQARKQFSNQRPVSQQADEFEAIANGTNRDEPV